MYFITALLIPCTLSFRRKHTVPEGLVTRSTSVTITVANNNIFYSINESSENCSKLKQNIDFITVSEIINKRRVLYVTRRDEVTGPEAAVVREVLPNEFMQRLLIFSGQLIFLAIRVQGRMPTGLFHDVLCANCFVRISQCGMPRSSHLTPFGLKIERK